MKTGFPGTFVISWDQTEIDGLRGDRPSALRVGVHWCWQGDALRVDGAADVLRLGLAKGEPEARRRAAASVRRLVVPVGVEPMPRERDEPKAPIWSDFFEVTDGKMIWEVGFIDRPHATGPLLVFYGDLPPRGRDLWVARLSGRPRAVTETRRPGAGVICFTPGTQILTDRGPVAVEDIAVGDRVQTKDNGFDEVRWTGARHITGARLYAMPHLAPILFRPGSMREGVPDEGLLVSPDHRVLLRGALARDAFGTDEVLAAARDLVNDHDIVIDRCVRAVVYHHLLLSRHQIVFANGVETESFHPDSEAFDTMCDADRDRLLAEMPELAGDPTLYGETARRVLSQSEATILRGLAAR